MLAHRWNTLLGSPSWDSLFEGFAALDPTCRAADAFVLPVNIADDGDTLVVEAEVPGVTQEGLEVVLEGRQLTLKAERAQTREEGSELRRRERRLGKFRRVLQLPVAVAADQVSAKLEHGVLTVHLPKAPEARTQRIEIQN